MHETKLILHRRTLLVSAPLPCSTRTVDTDKYLEGTEAHTRINMFMRARARGMSLDGEVLREDRRQPYSPVAPLASAGEESLG